MAVWDSITSIFSSGSSSDNKATSNATSSSSSKRQPEDVLRSFISNAPNARYTFDSERDAPQSELCREQDGERRRECIMIHMHSKRLFAAMQANGFFCALPLDPTRTYIECTPIPKQ